MVALLPPLQVDALRSEVSRGEQDAAFHFQRARQLEAALAQRASEASEAAQHALQLEAELQTLRDKEAQRGFWEVRSCTVGWG